MVKRYYQDTKTVNVTYFWAASPSNIRQNKKQKNKQTNKNKGKPTHAAICLLISQLSEEPSWQST